MANHNGKDGLVKIGSNTLGELRSYSYSETGETIDTTTLSDTAKTSEAGHTAWAGNAEVFWDPDDAAQDALSVNSSITISFYPEGATTGDKYKTGTCWVTELSINTATGGMVEASFNFTGNGALTEATV